MIKIIEDVNLREQKYNTYLMEHISNTKKAWNEFLKIHVKETLIPIIDELINSHDASKFDEEEYNAYLNYFYPKTKKNKKDEEAFNYAWNHHQKCNPHHWQYWILIEDDNGKPKALDMPEEHVICMLSDWSSFQYTHPGSTANKWYNDNKHKMVLSNNTKKLIKKYLNKCSEL